MCVGITCANSILRSYQAGIEGSLKVGIAPSGLLLQETKQSLKSCWAACGVTEQMFSNAAHLDDVKLHVPEENPQRLLRTTPHMCMHQ